MKRLILLAAFVLILSACEDPVADRAQAPSVPVPSAIVSVESGAFSSRVGDAAFSIVIAKNDSGVFARRLLPEYFSITTRGTGGYAALSGCVITRNSDKMITLTHLNPVTQAGQGQKITVAAAALAKRAQFVTVTSMAPESSVALPDDGSRLEEFVQKITFASGETYKDIAYADLNNQSIYMVQMNRGISDVQAGGVSKAETFAPNASRLRSATPDGDFGLSRNGLRADSAGGAFFEVNGVAVERRDAPYLAEFAANPLPASAVKAAAQPGLSSRLASASGETYSIGSEKYFWAQGANQSWQQIKALLQYRSSECDVWVAEANYDNSSAVDNDNKLTQAQARALGDKFSAIYELETQVFGYEFGGGPDGDGGVDGEKRVQILVFDLDFDSTPTQTGGVLGFFYPLDEFSVGYVAQHYGSSYHTNVAEIIYVDAHITDKFPSSIYSTLVHEFQHLINFNQKYLNDLGLSETWFTEMMSMLAEDLISPMINIPISDSGHPVQGRIPYNLENYNLFPIYGSWANDTPQVYYAYSANYAFGAYLVRNYGGPNLVKLIATSMFNDVDAINHALGSLANPRRAAVADIDKAFARYGEALVYSGDNVPSSVMTFNRSASAVIGQPGATYTYQAFSLDTISRDTAGHRGPMLWPANERLAIGARTLRVQTLDAWREISGAITVRVYKPSNPNIDVYLMTR